MKCLVILIDGEPAVVVNGNYPIQNMFEWEMNINDMKRFAFNRPEHQRNHIVSVFGLSGKSNLDLSMNDESMGYIIVNEVEKVKHNDTLDLF